MMSIISTSSSNKKMSKEAKKGLKIFIIATLCYWFGLSIIISTITSLIFGFDIFFKMTFFVWLAIILIAPKNIVIKTTQQK